MNVLVTGANGFIGNKLLSTLSVDPVFNLFAVSRSPVTGSINTHLIDNIDSFTNWSCMLKNQHVVIHTAARAHIMKDEVGDRLVEYRRVNVGGTLNLARQAVDAGVKRFIFLSSIKVNGEQTSFGQRFTAQDNPAPEDAYGISKYEAEQGLIQIAAETGLEVVIIRPPLVYGPGVKGNFSSMTRVVKKGFPLPLGAVHNKRSLVALDNLVDLIITCIDNPAAANQVFLAGDGEDFSTTELLRAVAKAAGVPSNLIPLPASVLMFIASLLGKKEIAQRLLGSLQVDISKARDLLGWTPPLSVEEGLRRCFVEKPERY